GIEHPKQACFAHRIHGRWRQSSRPLCLVRMLLDDGCDALHSVEKLCVSIGTHVHPLRQLGMDILSSPIRRDTAYRAPTVSRSLHSQMLRRVTASVLRSSPAVVMTPPTSMITSAGMFARLAASRIASALDASYKQYVFFLSMLRKENSHCTPISAL